MLYRISLISVNYHELKHSLLEHDYKKMYGNPKTFDITWNWDTVSYHKLKHSLAEHDYKMECVHQKMYGNPKTWRSISHGIKAILN